VSALILSNYRPISLLSSFSKVIEKALCNRLIEYVNNNIILNSQQFGFRKNLATEHAIFKLTQEISTALNKILVGSIFFDLAKFFDSVNHSLLIQKLPYSGITGKAKLLLVSYLTNTFQTLQLDNTTSNLKTTSTWEKIKHGLPQGSVLGPPLFLLHINDLPMAIVQNATAILFADDTSIIITERNARKLQDDLKISFGQISECFHLNFLSLNIRKLILFNFPVKSK
jgi:hypothetical protein